MSGALLRVQSDSVIVIPKKNPFLMLKSFVLSNYAKDPTSKSALEQCPRILTIMPMQMRYVMPPLLFQGKLLEDFIYFPLRHSSFRPLLFTSR